MQIVHKILQQCKSNPGKDLLFKKEDTFDPEDIYTNADYAGSVTENLPMVCKAEFRALAQGV